MLRPLTTTAALTVIAGAADAATYRYDLTMTRTDLVAANTLGVSDTVLDLGQPSFSCEGEEPRYLCDGRLDLLGEGIPPTPLDDIYPETISGSLTLDTRFDQGLSEELFDISPAARPRCEGSDVLCRFDASSALIGQSASSTQFTLTEQWSGVYEYMASETGLSFNFDTFYDIVIDGTELEVNGIRVAYETTGLDITEIAPVPLPAGMALLPSALAFLAWRRRRAAASRG